MSFGKGEAMSYIKPGAVEPRKYQQDIAASALEKGSTLVVLPTGLGKTIVALLIIDDVLGKGKKVLFLSPTKPLAEQHWKKLRECLTLDAEKIVLLTGETAANKRKEEWEKATIIVATPQTAENDLRAGTATLAGYGLCIFDEAHRTVGKYAYTFVAEECKKHGVKALGLTASPGADRKKIEEIMATLEIENVEMRSESDEDVAGYVKPIEAEWMEVELPRDYAELKKPLEELIAKKAETLRKLGYLFPNVKRVGKGVLMEVQGRILRDRDSWKKFRALSLHAALMNLLHAHELLETQGISTFKEFFRRMEERKEKSKAVQGILEDARIQAMLQKAALVTEEHPKLKLLREVVADKSKTYIVFVQYRDQVKKIVKELNAAGMNARQFLGKKEGITQKEQQQTIEAFRKGEFNVLVASSIGEEGLDIPSVDCVVFYEPVPSEIRSIQRRGRAGRAKAGKVIFLITKGTRDEVAYWVAKKKEKRMKRIVAEYEAGSKRERGSAGAEKTGKTGTQRETPKTNRPRGQSKISDF
ncbi:putative ATP-dependent RNA helicase [Candidatus Burarchaeum australiense]|nr:putative ATP-dependent RNA helicase [Candidatus Burarchaeum australiense]